MSEERNPYAAPDAVVADVAIPSDVPAEHPHVKRACIVLWASLAVTVLAVPLSLGHNGVFASLGLSGGMVAGFIGVVLAALITWWVVAKLSAGRNWMRLLVSIIFGLSVVLTPVSWATSPELIEQSFPDVTTGALTLVQYGMTLAVLVLINTPSARGWFAAMKRSRR